VEIESSYPRFLIDPSVVRFVLVVIPESIFSFLSQNVNLLAEESYIAIEYV